MEAVIYLAYNSIISLSEKKKKKRFRHNFLLRSYMDLFEIRVNGIFLLQPLQVKLAHVSKLNWMRNVSHELLLPKQNCKY